MRHHGPLCASLLAITATATAQQTPQSAQAAYYARDYATCARLYGEQADRTPPVDGMGYEAAACLALAGDGDGAFARLQSLPWHQLRSGMAEEADLTSLRDDPRWPALLQRARAERARDEAGLDHALVDELKARAALDQAARRRMSADPRDAAGEEAARIDRDNTAWLKDHLANHGWPGYDRVGREGSQAAWLLVQHADHDRAFQERALAMLATAVERGQASGTQLAYLTDRVRIAQGKRQVYGTQFQRINGGFHPRPIADADDVDARRMRHGLPTLAEYAAALEAARDARAR
jgi:hypothetical protein